MAVVMKQLNRSDEAIEAIKSFRHLCPLESQESIDNVLVELYKVAHPKKKKKCCHNEMIGYPIKVFLYIYIYIY